MNMFTAINDAMRVELRSNPHAVVFGEDVGFGGVFRCTQGLLEEFGPDRVLNMPINEQGLVGFGIGMAAVGGYSFAFLTFARTVVPVRIAFSPETLPRNANGKILKGELQHLLDGATEKGTAGEVRPPSSG